MIYQPHSSVPQSYSTSNFGYVRVAVNRDAVSRLGVPPPALGFKNLDTRSAKPTSVYGYFVVKYLKYSSNIRVRTKVFTIAKRYYRAKFPVLLWAGTSPG